ncbi:MAG: YaeQ family protein [Rhodanobacteraceae bacterium]|jgi:uncharacterized protein YaeQ|nr:YaeQ family protein [Rhodanobacteraceae bacterium]MBL0041998.1 YaeQ family protein [Xanthomonadales bacterium]MBP7623616.1 YaeQ family protein [Xanthomonadales bacterium]
MSPKSTVYKVELQISDLDRHYYQEHNLTLALHPSETEERLMVRLLAFAMNADERLSFGRGLSTDDEPDLWQRDDTGEIALWIETGQPEEADIRRACGRARQVLIYTYSGRSAQVWWDKVGSNLNRKNLTVIDLPAESVQALAGLCERTMRLQCMIEDKHVQLMNQNGSVSIDPVVRVATSVR